MSFKIGVDVGATSIKAGIIDEELRIIKRGTVKTKASFEKAMKDLADLVFSMMNECSLSMDAVSCAGVAVPCQVLPDTGRLVLANNANWKDVSIRDELRKYFSVPLYFGNDANCAVIGETVAGAAKGKKHVIMITLGTGVGSGIIIHGKLFTGGDGLGPECGHVPIVFDGLACSCGLNGCLEQYASASALIRQTKEAIALHPESSMAVWASVHGEINGQTAFDCAKDGDRTALSVVRTYCSYVAAGLGGLINLFRPEMILIGGGISNAGSFLLDQITELLPRYTLAWDLIGGPSVQLAALRNDAGIIGAACLEQMG